MRVAWLAWLVDLVLPPRCVSCGAAAETLCARCASELRRLRGPACALCGAPTAWPVARCLECAGRRLAFGSARAAVAYAGPARPLVRAWKERGLRRVAAYAAGLLAEEVAPPAADVITYIPPDPLRRLARGHHPAERLAQELASLWGVPVLPLLGRTRRVEAQRGLGLGARSRNVRGAFAATGPVPAAVVLVDDVYTTGATVSAGARALLAGGAARVDVLTFARTVRHAR